MPISRGCEPDGTPSSFFLDPRQYPPSRLVVSSLDDTVLTTPESGPVFDEFNAEKGHDGKIIMGHGFEMIKVIERINVRENK